MASLRRLSDCDVRSIFESVHNNTLPPSHLRFQIVPVGVDGLKLSPPSLEFEDGLYVLLKPPKGKNNQLNDQPRVPSTFIDWVMMKSPKKNCPWSLSGPQFPQPTAIQQRYCYPKGDPSYSSQKGGALWTIYGSDGKEDLEYRLLHVYFSAKRAVNKGVTIDDPYLDATMFCTLTEGKRIKRCNTPILNEESKELDEFQILRLDSMTLDDGWNSVISEINESTISNSPHSTNSSSAHMMAHPWNSSSSDCTEINSFQWDIDCPPADDSKQQLFRTRHETGLNFTFQAQSNLKLRIQGFTNRLEQIHMSLKYHILNNVPELEQGHYVSLVSNWAQELAASPLGTNIDSSEERCNEKHGKEAQSSIPV